MPEYIYINPNNDNDIKIIYQSVHDKHEYKEGNIQYKRVFTIPNTSSSTKLDPFDKAGFIRQLDGKHNETIGDTLDRSSELSAKRAEKLGKDPVREKYFDDFAKKRKGAQHPLRTKEQCAPQIAALKELGVTVNM